MYNFKNQTAQPNKNLTLSIGTAIFPTDAYVFADLFNIADKNLYQAKKNGRNQSVSNFKNSAKKQSKKMLCKNFVLNSL